MIVHQKNLIMQQKNLHHLDNLKIKVFLLVKKCHLHIKRKLRRSINMEIKNFNIYNAAINDNNPTKDLRKKKLHKKTISCLNSLTKK